MTNTARKYYTYSFIALGFVYLALMSRLSYPMSSVLKSLPIALILLRVLGENLPTRLRWMFALAVGFSGLGDIALTLPLPLSFEMGLGCFLIAHISYLFGFIVLSKSLHTNDSLSLKVWSLAVSGIVIASLLMLMYLIPMVGALWIPVSLYIMAISLMAIAASRCNYLCLIGAVSFMGSDSLLAYDTFIAQNAMHSFWIMLSYYTGQFFLVQGALRAYANIQSYEQNPVLMSPS